jgi:hypothetical protein
LKLLYSLAIHEPFQSKPWIKSVRADSDTYLIDYELNGINIQLIMVG